MGVRRGIRFVGLAVALLCLLLPAGAQATTFDVTNTNDSGAGSLRQAILDANAAEGADDIDATGVTGTVDLQSVLPSLSESVDIAGPGADQLTVRRDAGGEYRIFDIAQAVESTISGLTIANGSVSGNGGGIFNFGVLTLRDAAVTGNHADGSGGGIYTDSDNNFQGSLDVQDSAVTHNDADTDGGGFYDNYSDVFAVHDSIVAYNHADGDGGGIYLPTFDGVNLVSSEVRENSADGSGGGIGCAAGFVKASQSTISSNTAKGGGGISGCAVDLNETTVATNSATGGGVGGIGSIFDSTIEDSLITGNTATGDGGGISIGDGSTTIAGSEVSNNSAGGSGGGVYAANVTSAVITKTTVSDNTAGLGGGGVTVVQAGTITDSTISGNTATGQDANGGGLLALEILRLERTTIAENAATGGGGGIWARPHPGFFTLASSTVARNTAARGSNLFQEVPRAELRNMVLANPLGGADNCGYDFFFNNPSGGFNLADDTSCQLNAATDQSGVEVGLWPLADNGGPTETMIPASASPAIDHGSGSGTDQRGMTRPYDNPAVPNAAGGNGADIGAVELQDGEFVPNPPDVDLAPPETKFTIRPKKKIRTDDRRVELRFGFYGEDDVSRRSDISFECKLNQKKQGPCSSPVERKFKLGRHTFRIWASDEVGNTDRTPAKFRFKVKRAN